MPKLNLSHFEAALLFALFTSILLGVVNKGDDRGRLIYGAKCFGYFMLALFGLSWAMYLGHR
jgi:hypothetical protein